MRLIFALSLLLFVSKSYANKKVITVEKAKFSIEEVSSDNFYDPGKKITLTVLDQDGKETRVEKFKSGEGMGGYEGVNIPNSQPFPNRFTFSIDGGYDSRLIICYFDKKCENLPDGTVFVDKQKERLITFKGGGAEGGALAIYNFKEREKQVLITDWEKVEKYINQQSYIYTAYATENDYVLIGKSNEGNKEVFIKIDILKSNLSFIDNKPKNIRTLDHWSDRSSKWTRLTK